MSKEISKHQESGKHSLGRDVFFKGKREEITSEEDLSYISPMQENFQYDPSSTVYDEVYKNGDTERQRKLTKTIHEILSEKTEIDFTAPRRKPSKVDFNRYYMLIKSEMKDLGFSNVEIFNELAVYFSDNLFPIFQLLDKQWRNLILKELEDHIGKVPKESLDIKVKNLSNESEIEFMIYDEIDGEEKLITGVILDYNKTEEIFKVDSYENIYLIKIDDITKILNNRKYKYNLSLLNNIDFY